MKTVSFVFFLLITGLTYSQDLKIRVANAIEQLGKDEQFQHAVISMYVLDAKTGKPVYEKNIQTGMVPASCQKIVTSVSAFELLGAGFYYKTNFKIRKNADSTRLLIEASGDPTLGSGRWPGTRMHTVYKGLLDALKSEHVQVLGSDITLLENIFSYQPLPAGWVWEDIGNYYGAAARAFNWNENKYDLALSSGNNEGDATSIVSFDPPFAEIPLSNFINTGKKGSGDNAYIFSAPNSNNAFATGTIPPSQKNFVISGSMPDPALVFVKGLKSSLNANAIRIPDGNNIGFLVSGNHAPMKTVYSIQSPSLDSMNYWFLKKSINLYGEAFVKTIAFEKKGLGSTETGMKLIVDFWSKNGIEPTAMNIIDGSGLSPANRITTHALVRILQFAKNRPWYDQFFNALPEINGIKMKDGYISGVRSYTGIIKTKNGGEYIFSFIANNISGNPGIAREKMWKILDLLK